VDSFLLYCCTLHLCGHAKPDSHWMERTPFYKRGREVRDAVFGPIIPSHLDPEYPRRTMASIYFEAVHHRVPVPGDILHYQDIANLYGEKEVKVRVEDIQGAWARRLPDTPCPFRYEDGKMLIHQDDDSWKAEEGAAYWWNYIVDKAFDSRRCIYTPRAIPEQPTIRAVVFIESKDGKRRVKPFETKADAGIEMLPDKQQSPTTQVDHLSEETCDLQVPPLTVPPPTMGEHPDKYLARLDIWIAAALPDSTARDRRYRSGCDAIDRYEEAWSNRSPK